MDRKILIIGFIFLILISVGSFLKIVGLSVNNSSDDLSSDSINLEENNSQNEIQSTDEILTAESAGSLDLNKTTSQDLGNKSENITENITEDLSNSSVDTINETYLVNETEILNPANESQNISNITNVANSTDINKIIFLNETSSSNFTNNTEDILINSTEENMAQVNVSNVSKVNFTTVQYKAVIGRPVKWMKKFNATNVTGEVNIEIPKAAENITLKVGDEVRQAERDAQEYEKLVDNEKKISMTGQVSMELTGKNLLSKIIDSIGAFITGKVVSEENLNEEVVETEDNKIVNVTDLVDAGDEIAVEYYTEAPTATEEETSEGKQITISAPSELNYTDILAYTFVDEVKIEKVKLYWMKNLSGEGDGDGVAKEEINFTTYDLDDDGLVDYIEWIVPHLSDQVYEIIYIGDAVHLDENYSFVENVYDNVSQLDGNFSLIPKEHYLHVTFEQNLTNRNDITIWARAGCNETILIDGVNVPCDIYEKKMRIEELRRTDGE